MPSTPRWGAACGMRVFLLLSYSAQLVLEGLKALLGHKIALRRERIGVYLRVLRALTVGT